MSEHEWVQENLDAYVAGALSAAELGRVAQHVADCADCKQALTQAQKLETTMAELFADARPDAKLEDRMIRGLRKVRVPMRWPAWVRFAAGAAAVVLLGVVGAIVQAVAGNAGPPGGLRMASLVGDGRVQSTNNLGQIGMSGESFHAVDADRAATVFDTDIQSMNERLDERRAPRQQKANQTDLLDDTLSMGDEKHKFKMDMDGKLGFQGTTNLGIGRTSKVQEAGIDQGKAEEGLRDVGGKGGFGGMGASANGTFNGRGGEERERAGLANLTVDIKEGKALDSPPTSEGRLTGGIVGGKAKRLEVAAGIEGPDVSKGKRSEVAYFKPSGGKPSDGPAMTPPPSSESSTFITVGQKIGSPAGGAGTGAGAAGASAPPEAKLPPLVAEPALAASTQPKQDPAPGADSGLKIIRTGEMEFEVDSFDNAIKSIDKLIDNVKGGFKLTGEGRKQPNGKMRGNVVVRMPPQHLDKFVEDVRAILEKTGELKMQRIGSQDVTKQFTDTESELKAARAVEKRLLAIIENKKGEVKDLVAAEKELGTWRTKIEKMEGEIRYYANQVALSTLTINLVEKEIAAAAALVVNGTVKMRIEVDNVSKAREAAAEKAVEELQGHRQIRREAISRRLQVEAIAPRQRDSAPEQGRLSPGGSASLASCSSPATRTRNRKPPKAAAARSSRRAAASTTCASSSRCTTSSTSGRSIPSSSKSSAPTCAAISRSSRTRSSASTRGKSATPSSTRARTSKKSSRPSISACRPTRRPTSTS